ncbi:hypothetical protein FE391_22105 [Nonomuraea sp. KC401]|uniref:hypothetical protein n=1 Tax=unclassified Nonomuraea TaxID=2593643 RepID=UPI0010FEFE93|nr:MULTISPECIES: hypothetical protein [unclassified Nonomuraea]NBE93860.1 hypothetical protein [Nonomuraea sp. K271]TLF68476.1 hypothetical protein FE391_22105 [Nonomuraea sp. KC401]
MRTVVRRISLGMSAAVTTAAMVAILAPGPASAEVIVRWYPYTTAGAKSCNTAANAAGPEYYCTVVTIGGTRVYALARP